tara:strand:+ start:525 stop:1892 length:1368 start_codon:yes stop_codon:yes gene_type:complete
MSIHDSICLLNKYEVKNSLAKINIKSVSINSRDISDGEMFIGIIGDNFDGNVFYKDAVLKGASIVVIDKRSPIAKELKNEAETPYILVDDSITFLQELAKEHLIRWKSKGGKVICITGSNGKTTTKEMLTFFLKNQYGECIASTKGNMNNHIGTPLTILSILDSDIFAVIEIGTNAPGEIRDLSSLSMPDIGIITSVGESHLEKLGSVEGVFEEKTSLFEYIIKSSSKDSLEDSCFFPKSGLLENLNDSIYYVPVEKNINFFINDNGSYNLKIFDENFALKNSNIIGEYNFMNLSLAISAALKLGMNPDLIKIVLSEFKPHSSRSEWSSFQNVNVFHDYYNANPSSMKNAISAFIDAIDISLINCLFVIGDMYELGEDSHRYHQELGEFMKLHGISNVIYVGKYHDAFAIGFGKKVLNFQSSDSACLSNLIGNSIKYVFVKGSRGVQLEKIFIDD